MDPKACLLRMLEAAKDLDRDEFDAACRDLADWIRRGGFRLRSGDIPAGLTSLRGHHGGLGSAWCLWSPLVVAGSMSDPCWTLKRYGPGPDNRVLECVQISEPIL
jgi:hypothetical protein